MRSSVSRLLSLALLLVLSTLACRAAPPPPALARIVTIEGLDLPETVKYDPDQDVFFVSNMVGNVTVKDNNGFISRIDANDPSRAERFIAGGRNGAVLHGPKGMVLQGGVLWVADIDALRGFDARTGKPVETIDLQPHGAASLNDVDAHPDGSFYITDPRYIFHDPEPPTRPGEDRIFRVAPDRSVSVVLQGDDLLKRPNGIAWDTAGGQLLIAPLEGTPLFAWRPGETAPRILADGPGAYDGLEPLPGGRILVSSFQDGGVILTFVDGKPTRLIGDLNEPGNIGTDTRRHRLAIPLIGPGKVEIWQLPD